MKALTFTVPGKPVSKNEAYRPRWGSGGLCLTDMANDFFARVQAAAIGAVGYERPAFAGGRVIVTTIAFFGKDADAAAVGPLVQDALEGIAYANDSEVVLAAGWKGEPDPENPRTEVSVRQVTEAEILTREVVLPIPPGASFVGITEPPPAPVARKSPLPVTPARREQAARSRLRPSVIRRSS